MRMRIRSYRKAKPYRTSTSPWVETMKDPSGCFSDMYHLYSLSLPVALGGRSCRCNHPAHLSIWSQPPRGPGRPTIAREHTAAYVGSKWAACPGPPPNPPSGCCHCIIVSIALSTRDTFSMQDSGQHWNAKKKKGTSAYCRDRRRPATRSTTATSRT